ncbi:hypothetical protein ACEQ8H_002896 [Pleosporales sp. CAS-2024a]
MDYLHSLSRYTRTVVPRMDSADIAGNPTVLRPDDDDATKRLGRDAEWRTLFSRVVNDKLGVPNGYKKVEVLLIRWDEKIDDQEFQVGHGKEIKRLHDIFRHRFNFGCTIARIKNVRHPQLDLNIAIAKHVMDHDGEQNLLIVYYTGHGGRVLRESGDQQLRLSAEMYVDKNASQPVTAMWESAEEPLRVNAQADVLAVLDCCFASTAAVKGSDNQDRAYQLLAASSKDGLTSEPGDDSFTTAFCDALEELLDKSSGESFPLIKLHAKINEKDRKECFLWDRLKQYTQQTFAKIALGRLEPGASRSESFQKAEQERAFLTLRFSLKTTMLDDTVIKSLGKWIPQACIEAGLPVCGIDWVRFEQRDHIIREVVETFQRRMSATKKRKRSPVRRQEHGGTPAESGQSLISRFVLTRPGRDFRDGSITSEDVVVSGLRTPPRRSARVRSIGEDIA